MLFYKRNYEMMFRLWLESSGCGCGREQVQCMLVVVGFRLFDH